MPLSPSILFTFLWSQFFVTPAYPRSDCTGKTIIVTGANVGLGKEAARHFVRLGVEKLILACRTVEMGEKAKKEIEESSGRRGVVEVWRLDLLDYESVQSFAQRAEGLKRLDAVVENAGIATRSFKLVNGHESTIVTNVISTFLLALLLLPTLKRNAQQYNIQPTLTIVSSEVQFFASFDERHSNPIFSALDDPKSNMEDRYQVSKLLEVLVCREWARLHPQPDYPVVLNFVNPGFCHSELSREMSQDWGMWLMKKTLARTTEVGSRTLVHAALAGPDTHGAYLSNTKITNPASLVLGNEGPGLQRKVWKELEGILEEIQPGVTRNL